MQTLLIRNADYKLTVNLINPDTDKQQLNLKLISKCKEVFLFYQSTLTEENFLTKADSFFRSVGLSGIFQCFEDHEHFEINLPDKNNEKMIEAQEDKSELDKVTIKLKIPYQIRKTEHLWQGSIQISKKEASQNQILCQQIQQLKAEIDEIKKSQQIINNGSSQKIQKLLQQNKQLTEANTALKKQNEALVKELMKFKDQIKKIQELHKEKIVNLNKQLEELQRQSRKSHEQFMSSLQEQSHPSNSPRPLSRVQSQGQYSGRKMKPQQFNNKFEDQRYSRGKNRPLYEKKQTVPQNLLRFCNLDINKYDLQQKQVTLLIGKQALFYINEKIPANKTFQAQIKIKETKFRNIMIGVADPNAVNHEKPDENMFPFYWGRNGMILGSNRSEGNGFKKEDVVKMMVNHAQKKISWFVNDAQLASSQINQPNLPSQEITLYPCVILQDEGDSFEWLGSSVIDI